MEPKLSYLRKCAADSDWQGALRIAAKFQNLGEHKAAIKRAHEAFSNARFYSQIGKDPDALIALGVAALRERYSL